MDTDNKVGYTLQQLAAMIVEKYKDKPDDFPISIGHWNPDPILGEPHKEFYAFLRVDVGDWKQLAIDCRL